MNAQNNTIFPAIPFIGLYQKDIIYTFGSFKNQTYE